MQDKFGMCLGVFAVVRPWISNCITNDELVDITGNDLCDVCSLAKLFMVNNVLLLT